MPDAPSIASVPPAAIAKLRELTARFHDVERRLGEPEALGDPKTLRELSTQRAALAPTAQRWTQMEAMLAEARELEEALASDADAELAEMAREELPQLRARIEALGAEAMSALVTADDRAVDSVILELRAGVGGDEAGLWAGDLMTMYRRLAERRGWRFEAMDIGASASGAAGGGVKSAILSVQGEGVWSALKHEAGVHCVKRVPATETQGRIHTSTATVAVLPEPTDIDVTIDAADVEEHITTAQGPGGQNVNKVATAVHLVHTPTGVEVRMQETKSQRQNREKAWRLLRARVAEIEREKAERERAQERASQIGGAGRSERIRTYRAKESVAVDHRLGESINLDKALAGDLDALLEGLEQQEIAARIASL